LFVCNLKHARSQRIDELELFVTLGEHESGTSGTQSPAEDDVCVNALTEQKTAEKNGVIRRRPKPRIEGLLWGLPG
jgi:hypothetical protein